MLWKFLVLQPIGCGDNALNNICGLNNRGAQGDGLIASERGGTLFPLVAIGHACSIRSVATAVQLRPELVVTFVEGEMLAAVTNSGGFVNKNRHAFGIGFTVAVGCGCRA